MTPSLRYRLPFIPLLVCGLSACSASKTVFPPSGSVGFNIVDAGLGYQGATPQVNQVVRWTLLSASADIEGFGSYGFLGVVPCTYTLNWLVGTTFARVCGGSNLVLGAEEARSATVHLVISSMEVRRAFRPDLPDSGDYDGDGIPNGTDNCVLVPNPDQEVYSSTLTTGAACTHYNSLTGGVTVDTDGDAVSDGLDNCIWVPNSYQADSDSDGIGDACAQVARVVLVPQPYPLDLTEVTITPVPNSVQTLTVEFDDRKTLVGCDASFTRCYLDPEAVTVSIP